MEYTKILLLTVAMSSQRIVQILAVLLGFVFVGVAVIYATHTAGTLPTYFPSYLVDSGVIHVKHAIGAGVLAIACWLVAWFQSGPKEA